MPPTFSVGDGLTVADQSNIFSLGLAYAT